MMKKIIMMLPFMAVITAIMTMPAYAGGSSINGEVLNIYWCVPFAGMLLSIALMPMMAPNFWHHHYGKVALFWSSCIVGALFYNFSVHTAVHELIHIFVAEYLQFIAIIAAMFIISSGVKIDFKQQGTPATNVIMMLVASLIASWIGTTGAAMLFIRPLIALNSERQMKAHTMVFFILLVCNIGGSLTPIGDPPLFMGFLRGVDFFWPLKNMLTPFLFLEISLLIIYYITDRYFYAKEKSRKSGVMLPKFQIYGFDNLFLLLAAISIVIISGLSSSGYKFQIYADIYMTLEELLRCVGLFGCLAISMLVLPQKVRNSNNFDPEPFWEVAKLFAGIFITALPVLTILAAGQAGVLKDIIALVQTDDGTAAQRYFWVSGILSSLLDNAPTYMVFFQIAGGNAKVLQNELNHILLAISTGAVFMGAVTYIGNAPNFMVRSIAKAKGIDMPGFLQYTLIASILLFPLFYVISKFML